MVIRRVFIDDRALRHWFGVLHGLARVTVKASLLPPDRMSEDRPFRMALGELLQAALSDAAPAPVYLRQWPVASWPPPLRHAAIELVGKSLADILPFAHLWIGTRGVYTPTHSDDEDNLLIQIHGRKRVLIWPPSTRDGKGPPIGAEQDYPHLSVCLGAGDLLYLPKDWAHEVTALDGAVSLNFWHPLVGKKIGRFPLIGRTTP
ncbi:MAG: cupin-like domain-containing protein [Rhodobacter sp.]|nr:cupin-like domain-containing protein [Rhodobacter sp.]